jgi:hypothetical protein
MSIWEFTATQDGFNAFHSPISEDDKPDAVPTDEEYDDFVKRFG